MLLNLYHERGPSSTEILFVACRTGRRRRGGVLRRGRSFRAGAGNRGRCGGTRGEGETNRMPVAHPPDAAVLPLPAEVAGALPGFTGRRWVFEAIDAWLAE